MPPFLCLTDLRRMLQEHLGVLRRLATAAPSRFPELAALADGANEEADFFANVAHLQLHRRTRALARLSKARLWDPCTPPSGMIPVGVLVAAVESSVPPCNAMATRGVTCLQTASTYRRIRVPMPKAASWHRSYLPCDAIIGVM